MGDQFGGIFKNSPTGISYRELAKEVVARLHIKLAPGTNLNADEWKCFCPYHKDNHPSMYINPDKFIYHCFQCGASGSLHQLYHGFTGTQLLADLKIANDPFSLFAFFNRPYEPDVIPSIDPTIEIEITAGTVIPVEKSPAAMRYLRKRGISLAVANQMKMAYMDDGSINHTIFTKRLIIPISENNKLISIEGRDVTGLQDRKVLYPKNSSVNTLYDLDILDRNKPMYIMEGLMDLAVLRADPYFANSSALFGASISRRQLYLLNQFNDIVVIPDADEAGKKSLGRLKEGLSKPFRILEVPKLGGIKDVGDIPQKLHTTVENLRKRGWGRPPLKVSTSLIFY